jgi:hypothetical protein
MPLVLGFIWRRIVLVFDSSQDTSISLEYSWFTIFAAKCLVIDYASLALRFGIFSLFFRLNFLLLWSFVLFFLHQIKVFGFRPTVLIQLDLLDLWWLCIPLLIVMTWKVKVCSIMIMFYKGYMIAYFRLLEIQFRNDMIICSTKDIYIYIYMIPYLRLLEIWLMNHF